MRKNSKTGDKRKQNQNSHPVEPRRALMKRTHELLAKLKASSNWWTSQNKESAFFAGIDLGDRSGRFCFLDVEGGIVLNGLARTQEEFKAYFSSILKARIAMEVGTHSP